jgi:hypothetical protein
MKGKTPLTQVSNHLLKTGGRPIPCSTPFPAARWQLLNNPVNRLWCCLVVEARVQ